MTVVVFDLDGTLVDSIRSIGMAANATMAELDLPGLEAEETRTYVGNGAGHFVEQALSARNAWNPNDGAHAIERFLVHYGSVPGAESPPLPGVEATLQRLASGAHRLGICTNKPTVPTRVILEAHGWSGYFPTILCGDTLAQRKPDPEPLLEAQRRLGGGHACFVGDSEVDAKTAQAARIPFFLYTQGYRSKPIAELPHTATFDHFDELPDLIATLDG